MSSPLGTFRKRLGLTVQELADKAGVPAMTIVKDEQYGQRPDPKLRGKTAAAIGSPESVLWPEAKEEAERTALPLHIV